jgi:hypothetical protein
MNAGAAGASVAAEFGQHAEVPIDQPESGTGSGDAGERLAQPETGEDAHTLVVEVHRPRLRGGGCSPVDDQAVDAGLPEQCGAGQAGGSGSDDDDRPHATPSAIGRFTEAIRRLGPRSRISHPAPTPTGR